MFFNFGQKLSDFIISKHKTKKALRITVITTLQEMVSVFLSKPFLLLGSIFAFWPIYGKGANFGWYVATFIEFNMFLTI
jgi:hypothetical protein